MVSALLVSFGMGNAKASIGGDESTVRFLRLSFLFVLCRAPEPRGATSKITIHMRKTTAFMLMAMSFTLTSQSAVPTISYREDIPDRYRAVYEKKIQGKKLIYNCYGTVTPDQAVAEYKARCAASRADETCALTLKLTYDQEKEEQPDFFATAYDSSVEYPDSWDLGFFDEESGAYAFTVKPGTYNIFLSVQSPRGMIFLVKENVSVSADKTIELSTAEATNHITFKTLNRDGVEIKDDLLDPATDFTTVLDPGNIAEMTWNLDLCVIYNGNCAASYMINSFRMLKDDGSITSIADDDYSIWVNDNGCMTFGRIDTFGDPSGMGYVRHYAPECKTVEIVNDPADYVTVRERITPTPYVQPLDPDDEFAFKIEDSANFISYHIFKEGVPTRRTFNGLISSGKIEGVDNSVMNICAMPNGKFDMWSSASISQANDGGTLEGAKVRVNADRSVTRISTVVSEYAWDSFQDLEGRYTGMVDPIFAYYYEPMMAYGVSTPFAIVNPKIWDPGMPQFEYYFGGYMGESRFIDRLAADVTMKINGRQILDNAAGINDLFNSWWDTPLEKGKIELDITNTNHRTPEGLQGLNSVHMEFDTNLDDHEPPTLRALTVFDPAGMVQHSFESVEDAAMGFIELCANDLKMNENGFYIFDNPAPQVTVEYSAWQRDDFKPIKVTEQTQHFNAPGFGRHFTGSLPAVTDKAVYGWYDLRITLTDAAGNLQQQLISPAFQVRDMASMESIDSDSAAKVIAVYNIQGIRVERPAAGNIYIELLSDGTSRKVRR